MLTRSHFELVAEIISHIENYPDRVTMAQKAARQFTKENQGFDPEIFLNACCVSSAHHNAWHTRGMWQ